jgi:hypothetical protein
MPMLNGPKLRELKISTRRSHSTQDLLASPGLVISWKATKVEVAKSGDIGFVSGTYELAMNDASGKPVPDHGKYVEVWEKQANGKWKCGATSGIPIFPRPCPPRKNRCEPNWPFKTGGQ